MHECEERLADERVGLLSEVAGEYWVQINEVEAGREQGPVCKEQWGEYKRPVDWRG